MTSGNPDFSVNKICVYQPVRFNYVKNTFLERVKEMEASSVIMASERLESSSSEDVVFRGAKEPMARKRLRYQGHPDYYGEGGVNGESISEDEIPDVVGYLANFDLTMQDKIRILSTQATALRAQVGQNAKGGRGRRGPYKKNKKEKENKEQD